MAAHSWHLCSIHREEVQEMRYRQTQSVTTRAEGKQLNETNAAEVSTYRADFIEIFLFGNYL